MRLIDRSITPPVGPTFGTSSRRLRRVTSGRASPGAITARSVAGAARCARSLPSRRFRFEAGAYRPRRVPSRREFIGGEATERIRRRLDGYIEREPIAGERELHEAHGPRPGEPAFSQHGRRGPEEIATPADLAPLPRPGSARLPGTAPALRVTSRGASDHGSFRQIQYSIWIRAAPRLFSAAAARWEAIPTPGHAAERRESGARQSPLERRHELTPVGSNFTAREAIGVVNVTQCHCVAGPSR